jgi:hypothetical protein
MLSRPLMSGMSSVPRLAYVTGAPSMFGPSVRNHAMTLSVAQKRSLATTSMADIQRVNNRCRRPSERTSTQGDWKAAQVGDRMSADPQPISRPKMPSSSVSRTLRCPAGAGSARAGCGIAPACTVTSAQPPMPKV